MQIDRRHRGLLKVTACAVAVCAATASGARADAAKDRAEVAALDVRYQAAVAVNDAAGMDAILADDFVLVTGVGKTYAKKDLLESARSKAIVYERQEEIPGSQTVRVWNDTAVVTARLWLKGTQGGQAFDYQLWFSDTYVRTPAGWRYAFGQAAQRLAPGQ
jgi:ketosteroid isomerase-like protein